MEGETDATVDIIGKVLLTGFTGIIGNTILIRNKT